MIKRIVIHATDTPGGMNVTLDDIEDMRSVNRNADPMPYHYIINPGGYVLKGKRNNELCGHCGRFSADSLSVAYMGGIDPETEMPCNTMNSTQENMLRFLIRQWANSYPDAEVVGANALLHPNDPPEDHEPYFDVPQWLATTATPVETGHAPSN